ncbi:hypothetical protein BGZ99_004157, partial [Dissophora globulifera]
MLRGLSVEGCESVSMRVFRGPWVCNKLEDLNISRISIRSQFMIKSMSLQEKIEDKRFPLTSLLKTRQSDDSRSDETRRTLNEFYKKLGQFDQLKSLNMAKSDYRVRVQDGLDLVLPALTKNL